MNPRPLPERAGPTRRSPRRVGPTAPLDLALQGGGSHGAFTWGVLDRLLEDEGVPIDGISGTSAGALNAAVLATGWGEGGGRGGREGARQALRAFWMDVATSGECFGAFGQRPKWTGPMPAAWAAPWAQAWAGPWTDAWTDTWADAWRAAAQGFWQSFSPAQLNPLDLNLLRDVLMRHVRPVALRQAPLKLFVTATAVRTGQPRVFSSAEISVDALLASACLPQLFKPVMLNGRHASDAHESALEPYWDGGYSGNPALWPLIYETKALDVLLVRINPLVHAEVPDTALEIADRLNEITFNAGLVGELRAIHFVQKLVAQKKVSSSAYKNLRLHMVGDDAHLGPLNAASKLDTRRAFLEQLFAWGREAADAWLAQHRGAIGRHATVNIEREFLQAR